MLSSSSSLSSSLTLSQLFKVFFYYYHHFVIFILKIKAFGKCLYFLKFNPCQVTLFFHGKLYRGNRALKVDARRFGAFDSPNCPPLATVEAGIEGKGQYCASFGWLVQMWSLLIGSRKGSMWGLFLNPLHTEISMYILHTFLYPFPEVLIRRICLTIKSLYSWWLLALISW